MFKRIWLKELLILGALAGLLVFEKSIENKGYELMGEKSSVVEWTSLSALFTSHMQLVITSMIISLSLAIVISLMTHMLKMNAVEALLVKGANFTTAFPTIAVIALLVPTLGYGFRPVFIALVLYSFLPVFMSTIEGLKSIDESVITAAQGCGLTKLQILFMIELPLARPMILSGIKTSLILNIATATIGSVVGVSTLGLPIVLGIRTDNIILILKGALPVALVALLIESLFLRVGGKQKWQLH